MEKMRHNRRVGFEGAELTFLSASSRVANEWSPPPATLEERGTSVVKTSEGILKESGGGEYDDAEGSEL